MFLPMIMALLMMMMMMMCRITIDEIVYGLIEVFMIHLIVDCICSECI